MRLCHEQKGDNMYKRGKIFWERFVFTDGQSKRMSLGTGNEALGKQIAEKIRTDILTDKHFGTKLTRKRITVRKLFNDYYDLTINSFCRETQARYRSHHNYWVRKLGDRYAHLIDKEAIRQLLIEDGKKNGLSATHNKFVYGAKVFKSAVEDELLDETPFKNITIPKENKKRVRYLSKKEEQDLFLMLNQPKHTWLKSYCIVALQTGLRRKNMCEMTWDHVDFEQETLEFEAHEMKNRKPFSQPMTPLVVKVLKKLYNDRTHDYVFSNHRGNPIDKQWLSNRFTRFIRNYTGIKNFRLHDMRHDFCSKLVQKGTDFYVVSKLMSHSSVKQTEKYANLAPKQKRNALLIFDKCGYDTGENNSVTTPSQAQS